MRHDAKVSKFPLSRFDVSDGPRRGDAIFRDVVEQAFSLGEAPTERLDKILVAFMAFHLRNCFCIGRQRRRDRQPEVNEQR